MQLNDNTILITGGNSGIGRALAERFHALGNQVIITGRREGALHEVVAANPGMKSLVLDMQDADAIKRVAKRLQTDYPALNAVIHNAGIMRAESVQDGDNALDVAETTVATNLLGPIRLNTALLPHLEAQLRAVIMTVSSGLAFVPLAMTPTYDATKAAIHAYTQALRYQLQGTAVQVIELIPPYVQTELQGPAQARDPNAMPLADYITETIVERVKPQRFAEQRGEYDTFFRQMNDRLSGRAE